MKLRLSIRQNLLVEVNLDDDLKINVYRKKSFVVAGFYATFFLRTNAVLVHVGFISSLLGSRAIALDLAQLFLEILVNLLRANKECVVIWPRSILLQV